MKVSFILVKPAYPSNIGSTARALKTMGFTRLIVVDPVADLSNPRVKTLGKHADDLIDNIEIKPNLEEALSDVDIALAATHKIRHLAQTTLSSRQVLQYLTARSDMARHVAVVFGPESTGLSNKHVSLCDAVVQIPCAQELPSLNLAQAVMVLSYELSGLPLRLSQKQQRRQERVVTAETYHALKRQVSELLDRVGLGANRELNQRIVARIDALAADDLNLVYRLRQVLADRLN